MAEEGSTGVATETATAQSGSTTTASTGTTQATSQPAPKWEDSPQYKGQVAELQKERKARQDATTRLQEREARLAERERQIAALTNTQTPSKDQAEEQAVRDRFKQLYPHLADLTAEDVQAIREAKAQGGQTTQFIEQQWTNHHKSMLSDVHSGIAKELGDLTPRQIGRINAAYVRECEANPEFMARIEGGDKAATAQFVKEYLEDVVDPVKRKTSADNISRFRAVPNGKDRSVPLPGGKKIDPTNEAEVSAMLGSHFREKSR